MDSPAPIPSAATSIRACQSCATAKSRCVAQSGVAGGSCARCFRLKKECIPTVPTQRKRRSPKPTRTTQLEEKLESLVSLLASTHQPAAKPADPTPLGSPRFVESITQEELTMPHAIVEGSLSSIAERRSEQAWPRDCAAATAHEAPHASLDACSFSSGLEPSAAEAASLLDHFRTFYVQHFPFVTIPVDMSSEVLRQQKPYLYRTIMMVAAHDQPVRQLEMGHELLLGFSTTLLLKAEKSLDLLQAMLVYNAWQYYHFSTSSRTTTTLQLTLGLMFELGIRAPQSHEKQELFSHEMKDADDKIAKAGITTADEQRAFLGCFFLASVVSLCFKKIDGLRYSPYIETCCDTLSSSLECRFDIYLVASVRLQCIIERMQDVLSTRSATPETSKAPAGLHVNMFRAELQSLKASLPLDIQKSLHFALHYHSAEIHLYEFSIHNASSTIYGTHSCHRLDMLYACLVACRSYLDISLALPPDSYFSLPTTTFGQMTFALASVFKLSLLEAPGWDLQHVRQELDVSRLPDRFVGRFEDASRTIDPKQQINGTDAFGRCAQRFRQIKRWYDMKVTAESGPDLSRELMNASRMEAFEFEGQSDFLEEAYWQDIMRGW